MVESPPEAAPRAWRPVISDEWTPQANRAMPRTSPSPIAPPSAGDGVAMPNLAAGGAARLPAGGARRVPASFLGPVRPGSRLTTTRTARPFSKQLTLMPAQHVNAVLPAPAAPPARPKAPLAPLGPASVRRPSVVAAPLSDAIESDDDADAYADVDDRRSSWPLSLDAACTPDNSAAADSAPTAAAAPRAAPPGSGATPACTPAARSVATPAPPTSSFRAAGGLVDQLRLAPPDPSDTPPSTSKPGRKRKRLTGALSGRLATLAATQAHEITAVRVQLGLGPTADLDTVVGAARQRSIPHLLAAVRESSLEAAASCLLCVRAGVPSGGDGVGGAVGVADSGAEADGGVGGIYPPACAADAEPFVVLTPRERGARAPAARPGDLVLLIAPWYELAPPPPGLPPPGLSPPGLPRSGPAGPASGRALLVPVVHVLAPDGSALASRAAPAGAAPGAGALAGSGDARGAAGSASALGASLSLAAPPAHPHPAEEHASAMRAAPAEPPLLPPPSTACSPPPPPTSAPPACSLPHAPSTAAQDVAAATQPATPASGARSDPPGRARPELAGVRSGLVPARRGAMPETELRTEADTPLAWSAEPDGAGATSPLRLSPIRRMPLFLAAAPSAERRRGSADGCETGAGSAEVRPVGGNGGATAGPHVPPPGGADLQGF